MSEASKETLDVHLKDTIQMFEQILEVMPDDEMALRTLYDAYMQVGKTPEAYSMLVRLSEVVLEAHADDHDMLEFLIGQYDIHADLVDEQAHPLLDELKRRFDPNSEGTEPAHKPSGLPVIKTVKTGENDRKDAEFALAWTLFQEQVITQEDYDQTIQDLTIMTTKNAGTPATVLHVLSDRSYTHFSSVMNFIARQSSAPFIALTSFDLPQEIYTLLPLEFITQHAAIPFKMIGNELLIAVLNPFDEKLKQTLQKMTDRVCHTYLVTPEDYDLILGKARDVLSART